MVYFGIAPTAGVALLPLLICWRSRPPGHRAVLSALNVQYETSATHSVPHPVLALRDAGGYPASQIPERWRCLVGLNPMAGVVKASAGRCWHTVHPGPIVAVSVCCVTDAARDRAFYFRRMERTFADIV